MSDAVIQVNNLGKQYRLGQRGATYKTFRDAITNVFKGGASESKEEKQFWALKDVSFEINKGEVIGIVGKNGAGKSTLLKVLSRITEPTTGKAVINGRVGSLLEVGTGFHPELTGRENTYLNGAILGMTKKEIESKYDEIVKFAELERFMDTPVKFYSSGMYVRLAFSVAAHLEPEILLIDEVLAVGDLEFQKKCIGAMEDVSKSGRTVMVVSHNMSTVKELCSRAILLDGGEIKKVGDTGDVISEYVRKHQVDVADKKIKEEDHSGGDKIRVSRVHLLNGVENSFKVYWKQPLQVSIDFEVFEEVDEVSFGGCIRQLDGSYLIVVYNDDGDGKKWELTPGQYNLVLEFDNCLKPGIYIFSVGAHQRHTNFKNLFHLDVGHLEILGFDPGDVVADPMNPAVITGVKSNYTLSKK